MSIWGYDHLDSATILATLDVLTKTLTDLRASDDVSERVADLIDEVFEVHLDELVELCNYHQTHPNIATDKAKQWKVEFIHNVDELEFVWESTQDEFGDYESAFSDAFNKLQELMKPLAEDD
ncbi:MAG: hypothetical protein KJ043_07765 [Anaerolineae bacterium]|nr:hypothetical protein [Anaerolineae bacterium]